MKFLKNVTNVKNEWKRHIISLEMAGEQISELECIVIEPLKAKPNKNKQQEKKNRIFKSA